MHTDYRVMILPGGTVCPWYSISAAGIVVSWHRHRHPVVVRPTVLPSGARRVWIHDGDGRRRGYLVRDLVRATWPDVYDDFAEANSEISRDCQKTQCLQQATSSNSVEGGSGGFLGASGVNSSTCSVARSTSERDLSPSSLVLVADGITTRLGSRPYTPTYQSIGDNIPCQPNASVTGTSPRLPASTSWTHVTGTSA